mgnify:FL=1
MELKDYIRVIRRRWPWLLAMFCVIVGGYWMAAATTRPRIYHATCQLVINPTRVPTLFQGIETYFPASIKMGFETRVAGLRGRQVQKRAAERLAEMRAAPDGARFFEPCFRQAQAQRALLEEEVLAALREAHPGVADPALRQREDFPALVEERLRQAALEGVVAELGASYTVETLPKTELVELRVVSDAPLKTVAIANTLVEAAIEFNVQLDRELLAKAREKGAAQMRKNNDDIHALVQQIKRFREDHQIGEPSQTLAARKAELCSQREELLSRRGWMDKLEQSASQREEERKRLEALRRSRGADDPEVTVGEARLILIDRQHAEALQRVRVGSPAAPSPAPSDGERLLTHLLKRREGLEETALALRSQLAETDKKRQGLVRRQEMEMGQFLELTLSRDPLVSRMAAQREAEEKRLEALRARYTEAHPEVQATERSLADLRRQHEEALGKFRKNASREHTFQLAMADLDRVFLEEELKRRDAELRKVAQEALGAQESRLHSEQGVFLLEKAFVEDEIRRKDAAIAEMDAQIRRVEGFRFDEEMLLGQQRQLEADNTVFSTFLAKSSLVGGPDAPGQIRPVERFEDPLTARDARLDPQAFYPMLWFMGVIGVLGGLGIVFLVEYMDTTLKTEHDVRRYMNLPVLGIVPHQPKGKGVLLPALASKDVVSEVFQAAATLLRSAARDLGLKTFAVTSTVPDEGKTTTSINLAVALARKGLSVILVDADLRKPRLHALLGVDNGRGLATFLSGGGDAPQDVLQETAVANLRVIPSGPVPGDPLNLLEGVRMKALLEELKGQADFVLCDTPPISSVGDTLTLAALCDATVFVVGAGLADQRRVAWAKHLLSHIEARVLGCILNNASLEAHGYYYYDSSRNAQKSFREW